MHITVALALGPRQVLEWSAQVPESSDVGTVLSQVPWREKVSDTLLTDLQLSVWGRAAQTQTILQEGDRIELTRPLKVDPKEARRERFNAQGKRTTGLFARQRR